MCKTSRGRPSLVVGHGAYGAPRRGGAGCGRGGEEVDDVAVAVLCGVVDGSLAEVVLVVGLGPVADEPLGHAQVTLGGREVERRGTVAVAGRHGQRLLQDLSGE